MHVNIRKGGSFRERITFLYRCTYMHIYVNICVFIRNSCKILAYPYIYIYIDSINFEAF